MLPKSLSVIEILAYTFSFVFMFWPLILLGSLPRRRRILDGMLSLWGLLAVMRVFLIFVPKPLPPFFIPEPLNTTLFFVAGAVLLAIRVGLSFGQNRDIRQKANRTTRHSRNRHR